MEQEDSIIEWLSSNLRNNWSSFDFAHQIRKEHLAEVKEQFSSLETSVKLNILFSFVAASKMTREEMQDEIKSILHLSLSDDVEWVSIIGSILQQFLDGLLDYHALLSNNDFKLIYDAVTEKFQNHCAQQSFYPVENCFLSYNLFDTDYLKSFNNNNHFNVRKEIPRIKLDSLQKSKVIKSLPSSSSSRKMSTGSTKRKRKSELFMKNKKPKNVSQTRHRRRSATFDEDGMQFLETKPENKKEEDSQNDQPQVESSTNEHRPPSLLDFELDKNDNSNNEDMNNENNNNTDNKEQKRIKPVLTSEPELKPKPSLLDYDYNMTELNKVENENEEGNKEEEK